MSGRLTENRRIDLSQTMPYEDREPVSATKTTLISCSYVVSGENSMARHKKIERKREIERRRKRRKERLKLRAKGLLPQAKT
jgi:hypothetical protein